MEQKEYIDREALIRYTEKQEVIIKDGTSIADAMRIQGNVFRRCVETCPAADVAPVVHGEWVNCKNGDATCSRCGIRQRAVYDDDNEQHYCGHCGAKMDGERKEK